jgi:hypothetical protein
MSIESKHAYRFGFLKSEHWKGVREIALVEKQAHCEICGKLDWKNDVHHVQYRASLFKSLRSDFRVLCRGCHGIVHFVMSHRKAMGQNLNRRRSWRNIKRSAKRIHVMSLKTSPEIAIIRIGGIYKELEFARAAAIRVSETRTFIPAARASVTL